MCFILFKLLHCSWKTVNENATSRTIQLNVVLQHFQHSFLNINDVNTFQQNFACFSFTDNYIIHVNELNEMNLMKLML